MKKMKMGTKKGGSIKTKGRKGNYAMNTNMKGHSKKMK